MRHKRQRRAGVSQFGRLPWALVSHLGLVLPAALTIALGANIRPGLAAERLTIRVGPIERSLSISKLEDFVETGELRGELKPLAPLLAGTVREALGSSLELDSNLAIAAIDDLLKTPAGDRILRALLLAFPESTIEDIKTAIRFAIEQANGLSVLGILKAFPQDNLTVDLSAAIAVVPRINTAYLETQIVRSILKRELTLAAAPFDPPFNPTSPGTMAVRQETLNLRDRKRQRTIAVDIYWGSGLQGNRIQGNGLQRNGTKVRMPGELLEDSSLGRESPSIRELPSVSANSEQQPLVVMSHGLGGDRKFLTYLARHLAARGITVASLEHPGSNRDWAENLPLTTNFRELLSPKEFIDRPGDISFLLDELENLSQSRNRDWPEFNTKKVVAVGHSFGGYTVLALAGARLSFKELGKFCQNRIIPNRAPAGWLECAALGGKSRPPQLRDRRIVGAIALNPVAGHIFGRRGLSEVATPVLVLANTEDAWAPAISHQMQPFMHLSEPKYLVTSFAGSHFSATDPDFINPLNTDNYLELEHKPEKTEPLRQFVSGISLAFVKQFGSESKRYQPFLTPAYAQYFSTADLPLRLNREIPPRLARWLETREETLLSR
ncbi:MAG: alpha/beta fold hydrolase [Oscillatoria sp. SIO1A7]|nr:alpha/beta fold hydrolase [Oscillatoria sp. SIO1A7]